MGNLIVFVVVSLGIVAISWKSLSDTRSHGFFRFFAFEGMLILFLTNRRRWFHDPFSILQIISWVLLCVSFVLAAYGFYLLIARGKPSGDFENTTFIVTGGVYKYIRHPLYASLLLLTWGMYLKDVSLQGTLMTGVISALLFATAKAEEAENIHKFGDEYAMYMTKTKMFVPYIL